MKQLLRRLRCWLNRHGAAESKYPLYGADGPLQDAEYVGDSSLYPHTCKHCGQRYRIGPGL